MKITLGLATALLLGTASTMAFADPTVGLYNTFGFGAAIYNDITPSEQTGETTDVATDTSFKTGYRALDALGYGFGNGFRTELEVGFSSADVDTGFISNNGRVTQFTVLGNGIYDFDTGTPFTPHIGFGIGFGEDRIGGVHFPAGIQPIEAESHVFTYQAIAGLEYAFAPELHVGVEYRYIGSSDLTVSPGSDPALPHSASFNINSNNVLVTLRLNFETPEPAPVEATPAPPPPPEPAPPPAPAPEAKRSFQVFFDFNKDNITAAAAKVIQAASDVVKAGNVAEIEVTGHTDTVGSAQYNQGLSERRADAVKKQLIADGVDGGEIMTKGVGKTGLLVPTADGVREAQNRRAEIVLE
jgi:OmpA-OmpF porin, OOP family